MCISFKPLDLSNPVITDLNKILQLIVNIGSKSTTISTQNLRLMVRMKNNFGDMSNLGRAFERHRKSKLINGS